MDNSTEFKKKVLALLSGTIFTLLTVVRTILILKDQLRRRMIHSKESYGQHSCRRSRVWNWNASISMIADRYLRMNRSCNKKQR